MIYALEGLSTVDPHVHVASLLTPPARSVLVDTTSGCIDDITNDLRRRHLDHLLAADPATIIGLNALLAHYDNPDHGRAPEPILIAQGTADHDVPSPATDGLVSRLCALGDQLTYRHYPGLDHGAVVDGSLNAVTSWIKAASPTSRHRRRVPRQHTPTAKPLALNHSVRRSRSVRTLPLCCVAHVRYGAHGRYRSPRGFRSCRTCVRRLPTARRAPLSWRTSRGRTGVRRRDNRPNARRRCAFG